MAFFILNRPLSRLRTGSHNLGVELGRYTRPITPFENRICQYCVPNSSTTRQAGPPASSLTRPAPLTYPPDTEFHFLMECPLFSADRWSLFKSYEVENHNFFQLSLEDKFKSLLCPTSAISVKLVHRFIKSMFAKREKYDDQRL